MRGLPAKPLIDVNMVVADTTDEDAYVPPLEAIGYECACASPTGTSTACCAASIRRSTCSLQSGCEEVDRCSCCATAPHARRRSRPVRGAKRELAAQEWKYVQNYADAKSEVIQEILARART